MSQHQQSPGHGTLRRFSSKAVGLLGLFILTSEEIQAGAADRFSISNVMFFMELERTNPAMLKLMNEKWSAQEHRMVVNGRRTIACLRQFTTLFPTNIQFFVYSTEAMGPHIWTLQTGLYGRYLLRMQVWFKVDATGTNLLSYDPPTLLLSVYDDAPPSTRGLSEGRVFRERTLPASDWTKLVAARGDLAAIGLNLWTNHPIKGFEQEWRWRQW